MSSMKRMAIRQDPLAGPDLTPAETLDRAQTLAVSINDECSQVLGDAGLTRHATLVSNLATQLESALADAAKAYPKLHPDEREG